MTIKDLIATTIACLAFLISASTAYVNYLSVSDDVRVLFGRMPAVYLEKNTTALSIWGVQEVTFINSGNRSAAITSAILEIFRPEKNDDTCSGLGSTVPFVYQLDPFVLKPGEIAVKLLEAENIAMHSWKINADGSRSQANVQDDFQKVFSENSEVIVCFSVGLATPGIYKIGVDIPLYSVNLSSENPRIILIARTNYIQSRDKPAILVKQSGARIHW